MSERKRRKKATLGNTRNNQRADTQYNASYMAINDTYNKFNVITIDI
jgi:hypothetical protein